LPAYPRLSRRKEYTNEQEVLCHLPRCAGVLHPDREWCHAKGDVGQPQAVRSRGGQRPQAVWNRDGQLLRYEQPDLKDLSRRYQLRDVHGVGHVRLRQELGLPPEAESVAGRYSAWHSESAFRQR
jgi:hypothetical protein